MEAKREPTDTVKSEGESEKHLFGNELPVSLNTLPVKAFKSETKVTNANADVVNDVENTTKEKEGAKKQDEDGRFNNLVKTLKRAGAMNSEVHEQMKELAMSTSPESVFLGQPAIHVEMKDKRASPAVNLRRSTRSNFGKNGCQTCQCEPSTTQSWPCQGPKVANMHWNSQGLLVSDKQPHLLECAVLRDYQLKGLEWLEALDINVVNGILGDEMGLGKTVQVIAMICFLIERGVPGPFIILAPLAVVPNWLDQFNEFAPKVPTLKYYGTPETRRHLFSQISQLCVVDNKYHVNPVVVTSHGMPLRDKNLCTLDWRYLVVDEGHRLKNHRTLLHRTLGSWSTQSRIILTGTPLQNHLRELWSLLNFLLPDIFEDLSTFETWFDPKELSGARNIQKILNQEKETAIINLLRGVLEPFLMRRDKAHVNLILPAKSEMILCCSMSGEQLNLYNEVLTPLNLPDNEDVLIHGKKLKRRCVVQRLTFGKSYKEGSISSQFSQSSQEELYLPTVTAVGEKHLDDVKKLPNDNCSLYSPSIIDCSNICINEINEFQKKESSPEHTSHPRTDNTTDGQLMLNRDRKSLKRKLTSSNKTMLLRNIVNHPHLIADKNDVFTVDMIGRSSKMVLLEKMLPILKLRGHKILVFSAFKIVLDLIEVLLLNQGYEFCRLDGSVTLEDRVSEIKEFNSNKDKFVFLLTTRAGGLGLNLTAADTVIFYDADWNPHADSQAEDRCHRIGQTRPVTIYRLVAKNSIDTMMLERAEGKKKLGKLFLAENASFSNKLIYSGKKVELEQIEKFLSTQDKNFCFPADENMFSEAELKDLLK